MNPTSESESDAISVTVVGGRKKQKKNVTLKKHKSGNKVLAAWREHVKSVASAEGMTYGKDTMKLAKTGKYGKQWAQIKSSINSKKGGVGPNGTPSPVDESANKVIEEPAGEESGDQNAAAAASEINAASSELNAAASDIDAGESELNAAASEEGSAGVDDVVTAQAVTPGDDSLPEATGTAQEVYGGRRKRSTKKHKGKKIRKSRKYRKSRKH